MTWTTTKSNTFRRSTPTRPVWDPLVRIGHWTLVIAFFTAYLSGDDLFNIHTWAGYVVAGYVLVRIVWGVIGTRHARFTDFVRGPGAVLGYLRSLFSGKAKDYAGHNPAGGAMVIALLFSQRFARRSASTVAEGISAICVLV